jgi:NDP-sugar pyrophosphorylase family protein
VIAHALILAAGKSTRISSLAGGTPKPLLPVAGKPIVAHTLEWLAGSGIRSAWINLHYQADLIQRSLGDGVAFGVSLAYSYEPEILGTAGAWKRLVAHWTGTSLVIYGDNLMRFDLSAFLARHRSIGAPATVALFDPTHHPNTGIAGGRVRLESDGMIRAFVEGGDVPLGLVNAGAYLLEPAVAEAIGPGFQDFAHDVFPAMAHAGRLAGHRLEDGAFCLGLDTPESFRRAEDLVHAETVRLS